MFVKMASTAAVREAEVFCGEVTGSIKFPSKPPKLELFPVKEL